MDKLTAQCHAAEVGRRVRDELKRIADVGGRVLGCAGRLIILRAVDHEGEVLECFVTKRRNKAAAKKFLIKIMRKHGSPHVIATDKLPSYAAAFREIGIADRQLCGGRSNNRCENSHLPFRRRERAMQRFKTVAALQKFVSYRSQIYNHFNKQRHLESRQSFKQKRTTALTEWFNFCAT
jgi:putative transposase